MTIRAISEKVERETLSPFATLSEHSKGRLRPIVECDIRTAVSYTHLDVYKRQVYKELEGKQTAVSEMKGAADAVSIIDKALISYIENYCK